jgi:hypothetical protein
LHPFAVFGNTWWPMAQLHVKGAKKIYLFLSTPPAVSAEAIAIVDDLLLVINFRSPSVAGI